MSGDVFLTQEGYEKLREELEYLSTKKRREIAKEIEEARQKGDLKENAEYDAAKEAQGHLEKRIAELGSKLSRARIIENENIPKDKIFIGAKAKLLDLDTENEENYTLVSKEEANYDEGKISMESPIGKALLGKKVGDIVEIDVPVGKLKYKVLSITR